MTSKNIGKQLFAIYKKETHIGNSYGFDKLDALKTHLENAKFPFDKETLNEYMVTKAIQNVHYYKSDFVIMPLKNPIE